MFKFGKEKTHRVKDSLKDQQKWDWKQERENSHGENTEMFQLMVIVCVMISCVSACLVYEVQFLSKNIKCCSEDIVQT